MTRLPLAWMMLCAACSAELQAPAYVGPAVERDAAQAIGADNVDADLTIELAHGVVHGEMQNNGRVFTGIPYAAPPLAALRFAPPRAVLPWQDTLEATGPGIACMQPGEAVKGLEQREDCLTLNVFAPLQPPAAALPVMVWLHSGGNTTGSANLMVTSDPLLSFVPRPQRLYDGLVFRDYAERQIVVVTVNYRLGALGFTAHPGLSAEGEGASGNYGLMDQQAALRWVRDNIAAFGGDPGRVTLFGQGAGASDACYHLLADDSRGLFHAAALQGGSCGTQREPTLTQAEEQGRLLANELGCDDADARTELQCLRDLPTSALVRAVDAQELVRRELDALVVIDGRFLKQDAQTALSAGQLANVPLIIGNDDRCSTRECPSSEAERAEQLWVCPARALARRASQAAPVFLYSFTRSASFAPSPEDWTNVSSGSEQLWVWNIWPRLSPYSADDATLSLQMRSYWDQLIDGDVNSDDAELPWAKPHWERFDPTRENELVFDLTIKSEEQRRSARCL